MKNFFFSLLALSLFLLSSCKPDETVEQDLTADVEVNFVAEYQNEPLVTFKNLTYPQSDMTFTVKNFQFFITDLVLLQSGTADETELAEVELLDFAVFDTEEEAVRGTARSYEDIPVGTYSGIRLGLGVNRDLNRGTTGVYTTAEPLGQNFWDAWDSYIFAKIEGDVDTTGDDMYDAPEDVTYVLHTGFNETFRTVTVNTPITVTADANNVVKVVIDFEKIFLNQDGTVYDVVNIPQAHGTGNRDAMNGLMTNFSKAFSVE